MGIAYRSVLQVLSTGKSARELRCAADLLGRIIGIPQNDSVSCADSLAVAGDHGVADAQITTDSCGRRWSQLIIEPPPPDPNWDKLRGQQLTFAQRRLGNSMKTSGLGFGLFVGFQNGLVAKCFIGQNGISPSDLDHNNRWGCGSLT